MSSDASVMSGRRAVFISLLLLWSEDREGPSATDRRGADATSRPRGGQGVVAPSPDVVALAELEPERDVLDLVEVQQAVTGLQETSPYKTNAGAWLYHRDAGRKVGTVGEGGGAGFYFHIDPTWCAAQSARGHPPANSDGVGHDATYDTAADEIARTLGTGPAPTTRLTFTAHQP